MPSGFTFILLAIATLWAVSLAREASARLKAGRVRFRLPVASVAKPRLAANVCWILLATLMLVILRSVIVHSTGPSAWIFPAFVLCLCANGLQTNIPRRDAMRWLVLASGLLGLMTGVLSLAVGFRRLSPCDPLLGMPAWFFFVWSLVLFVAGVSQILEFVRGTQIREGAIETMGAARPWSRVVFNGWDEREDGFALRLWIVPSQPRKTRTASDGVILVPVPASKRPALEDFLSRHVANAGRLRVGENARGFPGMTPVDAGGSGG